MKKLLLLIGLLFLQGTAFALQNTEEEPSRFLLFLGRFHVLILHLPIGALLVTFYLDIVGRIKKNYPFETIKYGLGFSALFAILASVLGYFLSLEGGYETQSLDWHLYSGIVTAVIITIHFYLSLKTANYKYYLPFFILGIASIIVTGHFGSVLTHGDDFLTEYVKAEQQEEAIEYIDSLKLYDDVIAKIMDNKCISCHNNTKKKGDLSLLDRAAILKGGENGEVVLANHSELSLLYTNTLLPLDDEGHMPPEGKPQLTKDEMWLIKFWIDHGLDFEQKATQIKENDTLSRLLEKYLVIPNEAIPIASTGDISKLGKQGFQVLPIVPNEGGLAVKFNRGELTKKHIKSLLSLEEQIVELDLSNTGLEDEWTHPINNFKQLSYLRLDKTTISDKTLKNLENLEHLEVLNLHETKVTDEGLKALLEVNPISRIFVWNSQVDITIAQQLEQEFGSTIITGINEGFVEKTALQKPILETKQSFFSDSLVLNVRSSLRGTEVRYTLDGSTPDVGSAIYKEPLTLTDDTDFKAIAIKEGWYPSEIQSKKFSKVGYEVSNFTIVNKPHKNYPGASKLFDRIEGGLQVKSGKWTGYNGEDLDVTIDLGAVSKVDRITVSCLEAVNQWVFFPSKVEVLASNEENANFTKVGEQTIVREKDITDDSIKRYVIDIPNTKRRYFKVVVTNFGKLPKWHPAAGNPSWLFVDEILVK